MWPPDITITGSGKVSDDSDTTYSINNNNQVRNRNQKVMSDRKRRFGEARSQK